jgi:hypothetical protein
MKNEQALHGNLASMTAKELDIARIMVGEIKLRIRQIYRTELMKFLVSDTDHAARHCFAELRPLNMRIDAINREEMIRNGATGYKHTAYRSDWV